MAGTYECFAETGGATRRFGFIGERRVEFVVATSLPWVAPAHPGLCVHPDAEYVFYEVEPGRAVVVLKARLNHVLAELQPEHLRLRSVKLGGEALDAAVLTDSARILGYALGEELAGLTWRHALVPAPAPVSCSPHLALDHGTGVADVDVDALA